MKLYRLIPIILLSVAFCDTPYLIGICGGTCSGKTTFSQKLLELFKEDIAYITQDSYYKDFDKLTAKERREINYDHPDTLDFSLLTKHLQDLKEGKEVLIPNYSYRYDRREPGGTLVKGKKIILLDGHLIFAIPELANALDLKIFVDTDNEIRCMRRVARDLSLDRDLENTIKQYLENISPMHETYIQPNRNAADIVVLGEKDNTTAIDLVAAKIREKI